MTLKYYYDLMSQPSRALYIYLKLSKVPFESCVIALRKGEHLTEEFAQNSSRFKKVPFIHDGDFRLTESVAIVRYLSRKHNIDNHWYPQDLEKQAKVDEYLEWQHNNVRAYCAMYFLKAWLFPLMTGTPPDPKKIEGHKESMETCLDQFESLWLKSGENLYITGDTISVADIFAACEIEQPRMAGYEPRQNRPILTAWLDRVRTQTNPFYDETHKILNKIASSQQKPIKSKI